MKVYVVEYTDWSTDSVVVVGVFRDRKKACDEAERAEKALIEEGVVLYDGEDFVFIHDVSDLDTPGRYE